MIIDYLLFLLTLSQTLFVNTQLSKSEDIYSNLCLKYGDTVYGLISRSVKDPQLAEDLFLKVFLEIQKKNPSALLHEKGVLLHIILIVKHIIIQSGNQLLCTSSLKLDTADGCTVEMRESQEKTIFDLIFLDGYSIEDVSKKTGLSIIEIKNCIHQSVERLRRPTAINLP